MGAARGGDRGMRPVPHAGSSLWARAATGEPTGMLCSPHLVPQGVYLKGWGMKVQDELGCTHPAAGTGAWHSPGLGQQSRAASVAGRGSIHHGSECRVCHDTDDMIEGVKTLFPPSARVPLPSEVPSDTAQVGSPFLIPERMELRPSAPLSCH